jgi:Ser/Thr protein kinase RdoA (MazF antagonist)
MRYGLAESNSGHFSNRTAFPAQSSVLDEEALFHRVVMEYDIPTPKDCIFFSRGDSDIYRVHTAGPTFYLKVYRPPYSAAKAEAEARLLADLAVHGVGLVAAVRRRDGLFTSEVKASEGPRPSLLFEEAPPGGLAPLDEDTCKKLGTAVAQLHEVGDSLSCDYQTAFARGEHDELMPYARRLACDDDYTELQRIREQLGKRLSELSLAEDEEDIGLCHCDLVLSNIRRAGDGTIVFFDFANARYTLRSNELAGVRKTLRRHATGEELDRFWNAFQCGYRQVRRLPNRSDCREQLPILELLGITGWICGVMATCPLRMGTETFNREWVRKELSNVKELAAQILKP